MGMNQFYNSMAMLSLLQTGLINRDSKILNNGVIKKHSPWDMVQLSKLERKGKTFEQIQEARKEKWSAQQKGKE